ncbi:MAG: AraC family transcriptional regulator [Tannerellaceae bacterium]|jgi:AraC-like DNA-binding protein|nr:AraC family transcriptional regulator [Tannerellaceae bacterium]
MKQPIIPVHRMDAQTPLGIKFSYIEMTDEYDEIMLKSNKHIIHRDDYYLFLFLETATAAFTVDFEEIRLQGKSVFYIRPGQVHFASSFREAKGWTLAIDSMLVENDYKNTFEGQFLTQKTIALDVSALTRIGETARLLYTTMQAEPTAFSNRIILNLANVFIGIIAEHYANRQENFRHTKSRSALIACQFKELLSENFRTIKSPIQYAQKLNYSLSHLNESVKKDTGFPVSYWIHQQIVLEAKRLLYYTNMDVKEIAFSLGYEDHTYFTRLFSQIAGMPPNAFRRKFRE